MLQPQGGSNEGSQDMFSFRNKKNYLSVTLNTLSHLELWYVKVKDRTSLPQESRVGGSGSQHIAVLHV